MASQSRVVLLNFQLFGLELFVSRGGVAGRGLAFLARLSALDGNHFSGHRIIPFPWRASLLLLLLPRLRQRPRCRWCLERQGGAGAKRLLARVGPGPRR